MIRLMAPLVALAVAVSLLETATCKGNPSPVPPSPSPAAAEASSPPPPPPGPSTTDCQNACARLQMLACPEGTPVDCAHALTVGVALIRLDGGARGSCAAIAGAADVPTVRTLGVKCATSGP